MDLSRLTINFINTDFYKFRLLIPSYSLVIEICCFSQLILVIFLLYLQWFLQVLVIGFLDLCFLTLIYRLQMFIQWWLCPVFESLQTLCVIVCLVANLNFQNLITKTVYHQPLFPTVYHFLKLKSSFFTQDSLHVSSPFLKWPN